MIDKNYDIEVSWLPRVNSSSPFSYTPAEGALPSEWKKACAAQQTDVQLTTAEGGVFHAHATILSLRSSYLCKLFESRFAEGVSKQIKFEESSLLVQNMLYFLYNYQLMPEIKNDPNALAETLVFATRMDVDGDMKPLVSAAACELSQLIDREIKDFESAKHLFEYAKSTKNPTLVRVLLHFVNNNMQKFSWDFVTLVVKEEWVELHAAAQEINAKEVVQELENIKKYNLEFRNYLAESNNNNNNQG